MNPSVWLNGKIVPARTATVSALDPAVQHGLGVFEVTRAYGGEPYLLDRHLARMRKSARRFGLAFKWSDAAIIKGTRALLRATSLDSAAVRLVLTAGGSFLVKAGPLPALPPSWFRRGAPVDFAPWRRDPRAPLFGHKTLNYLENVLMRERAHAKGLADYLFLSIDGRVLEGTVSNVFAVRKGALLTPALEGILPGVTRGVVVKIAKAMKVPLEEVRLEPRDLERADEVFLTNALIEVLPVCRVGKRRLTAPGPITRQVAASYRLANTTI